MKFSTLVKRIGLGILGFFVIWPVFAYCIDHFAFASVFPSVSEGMTVKLSYKLADDTVEFPKISILILLGLPMVAFGFVFLPRKDFRSKAAWIASFKAYQSALLWLLVPLVLMEIGKLIYAGLKEYLPSAICEILQMFSFEANFECLGFSYTYTGTLAAAVGLCIGFYLFMTKGVRDTIELLINPPEKKS